MRNALALLLAVLCVAGPAAADNWFGMTPEDAQGMIGKALADEARHQTELEAQRKAKAAGPGMVDRVLGTYATLSNPQDCVFRAVARFEGQQNRTIAGAPQVYLESRTVLEDFQVYVHNERDSWPNAFSTTFLPQANIIFLDDHSSFYSAQRTLDDALAGQYAAALSFKSGDEPIKLAESWFHETYSKPGRSACDGN